MAEYSFVNFFFGLFPNSLLFGGAVRDYITGNKPDDFDFLFPSQSRYPAYQLLNQMGIIQKIQFDPLTDTIHVPRESWVSYPPDGVIIRLTLLWDTKSVQVDLFSDTTLAYLQSTSLDFLCNCLTLSHNGTIGVRESTIPRFYNNQMIDEWRIPMIKRRMLLLAMDDIRNKTARPATLGYYQPIGVKRVGLKAIHFMEKGWKIGGIIVPFVVANTRVINKEICCICHTNATKKEKVIRMVCQHELHMDCFKQLLEKFQGVLRCPLCRKETSFYAKENQDNYLEDILHQSVVYCEENKDSNAPPQVS